MQLMISDDAQTSIATAALQLADHLYRETGDRYASADIERILCRCLDALVDDWASDAFEHVTRPAPHGYSQTEFDRLLRRLPPQPPCN